MRENADIQEFREKWDIGKNHGKQDVRANADSREILGSGTFKITNHAIRNGISM